MHEQRFLPVKKIHFQSSLSKRKRYLLLLGLLGILLLLLLVLCLAEGSLTLGSPDLGLDVALGADGLEGRTDDTTLELLGALGPPLGNLLRRSLAVDLAVDDGPVGTARVLPHEERSGALSVQEGEGLHVHTHVLLAMSGVDLEPAEGADFGPLGWD